MSTDSVKTPPHSQDAEQAVLGGIMTDDTAWERIEDRLTDQDFYLPAHKLIFAAITDLTAQHKPADVLTVTQLLRDRNQLTQAGGEIYLFDLANNTGSVSNIGAYAEIVYERSVMRQLIGAANDIAGNAFKRDLDTKTLLDDAEQRIFAIAERGMQRQGPQRISGVLAKTVDHIDTLFHSKSAITGLSTGYADLDKKTAGLQPSDLIIVAGRPSMGKTSFALNMAEHVAIQEKKPVLIFSMEMSAEQLGLRMISSLGRIEQQKVRTGYLADEDWPRITSAVELISETPLFIDDTAALGPTDIRSRARRIAREQGELGLIVIDYLQLMQIPNTAIENRTLEVSQISRAMKALARELHVPVIALSQLNRGLEQRADKRPVMSDLRESGSLEQDADVIMFIYRDEVYNDNTAKKGVAEVLIRKQRNGPIGEVRLAFLGQYTRFENLSHDTDNGAERF